MVIDEKMHIIQSGIEGVCVGCVCVCVVGWGGGGGGGGGDGHAFGILKDFEW